MHRCYDLDQLRRVTASLRPDDGCIDAVYLDAIALAASKAFIPFSESLYFNRRRFCWEGLIQQNVQGAWEWYIAQPGLELAAIALAREEVLGLTETGCDFSAHEFAPRSFKIA